jgi:hypothetical protein
MGFYRTGIKRNRRYPLVCYVLFPEYVKNPFQRAVFGPSVGSYINSMPRAERRGEGTPDTPVFADTDEGDEE